MGKISRRITYDCSGVRVDLRDNSHNIVRAEVDVRPGIK